MVNRSRIQIAKPDIVAFFDALPSKILRAKDLAALLVEQRRGWRLAQSTTSNDFIGFLLKHAKLQKYQFDFPHRPETLYGWGDVHVLHVLEHLKPHSYFSHYTAVRMLGLTEQAPSTWYLTHERSAPAPKSEVDQEVVDEAFSRPARVTNNQVTFGEHRVVLINGAFTSQLGVEKQAVRYSSRDLLEVRVTSLERTLIDATVRPDYSGGVMEVAKAFELAKEQLSVNRLSAMLKKLDFVYPYHQAIGFYMERAGYRDSQLDLLRRFPRHLDFYLAREMTKTRYVKEWRLHVPSGF